MSAAPGARLLAEWRAEAEQAERAHSDAADYYGALDVWIGGSAAVLAGVIGTSVFATLGTPLSTPVRVTAALVTFAAAALSALGTFLKPGARAEEHREASVRYSSLEDQVEQFETEKPASAADVGRELDAIRQGLKDAREQAPSVPPRIRARAERAAAGV